MTKTQKKKSGLISATSPSDRALEIYVLGQVNSLNKTFKLSNILAKSSNLL